MLGKIISLALFHYATYDLGMDDRKQEIMDEWRKSMEYPRKKKKKVRKSLRLDWAIANFNIFDI